MENKSPAVAIAIPVLGIIFAAAYVLTTLDYPDPETVKFPYSIAAALTICFTIIAAREILGALRSGWRPSLPVSVTGWLVEKFRGKEGNPFLLVVLTAVYGLVLVHLNVLLTTFLYVNGLRLVFRNWSPKLAAYDAVAVSVLYLIFHDVLRIQLPSGPLESFLSGLAGYIGL